MLIKMPFQPIDALPDRAFHGTICKMDEKKVLPMNASRFLVRLASHKFRRWHERDQIPEEGFPYANIIWDRVGLRKRSKCPEQVREWARSIKSYKDLIYNYGMMFVTDNEIDASRYGKAYEVDLNSPAIVDAIRDPHVRTHQAWILILETGYDFPIIQESSKSTIENIPMEYS